MESVAFAESADKFKETLLLFLKCATGAYSISVGHCVIPMGLRRLEYVLTDQRTWTDA